MSTQSSIDLIKALKDKDEHREAASLARAGLTAPMTKPQLRHRRWSNGDSYWICFWINRIGIEFAGGGLTPADAFADLETTKWRLFQ